jgi:hypothetical protein
METSSTLDIYSLINNESHSNLHSFSIMSAYGLQQEWYNTGTSRVASM